MHNIGKGTVTLMDLGEEYEVTFPSGFGRSILTVPWVELGGKCSIKCIQTGYEANIEFKCKQFFSSDVNKVIFHEFFGELKNLVKCQRTIFCCELVNTLKRKLVKSTGVKQKVAKFKVKRHGCKSRIGAVQETSH